MNKIDIFNKAMQWIKDNTLDGNGITVTSKERVIYPEVTGYYIPSLLQWGERDRAKAYAKYLCSIQKEDGSWYDSVDKAPYVFDSAQILKGLVSIYPIMPEVKSNILSGCDWLISNMNEEGRLKPATENCFAEDETFYSELIHTYCLTPLVNAAQLFNREEYALAAEKIKNYYVKNFKDKILHFSLLSHFYAYVMEGLLDLGEVELVHEAMENLEKYQNPKGGIPGLYDVKWVCSTGMFQIALVWFKLGDLEKGKKIFDYACLFQNESGGWFGSYPISVFNGLARGRKKAYYFPNAEISWANKYFLDALAYKEKLEFEGQAPIFLNSIEKEDGRYNLIRRLLKEKDGEEGEIKVCDVGCGKGRYLKRLLTEFPDNEFYAMDLSENVMKDICCVKEKRTGYLTSIPYKDEMFDFVYVCEALEHAIYIEGAIKELCRIVKKGGQVVIIDKPQEKLGSLEIEEWEQWISDTDMRKYTQACGGQLKIIRSVPYENKNDGLFRAWILDC